MTDKPIFFFAPMIRALQDDLKSQTRRVLTPQPFIDKSGNFCAADRRGVLWNWGQNIDGTPCLRNFIKKMAPHQPGDRLWVKESCRAEELGDGTDVVRYLADDACRPIKSDREAADRWSSLFHYRGRGKDRTGNTVSPRHMPRWASRITLIVEDVRVQRLQDISEEDAIAEGLQRREGDGLGPGPGFKWRGMGYHGGTMSDWGVCYHTPYHDGRPGCSCNVAGPSPAQCAYRELWDRLNAKRGHPWSSNPWVAATTFRTILQNIDEVPL